MNDIAIRAKNLAKQYHIGGPQVSGQTFREMLVDAFQAPGRWMRGERGSSETFWALDDVSFEFKHGEAVGLIGHNGAGKSTLLKILSRITHPTRGRVELFGRVGSLLEVGTGFHTELSGRENIFLNGAILGMSRREIQRKFDEIVEFSEVGKFLDTPVKHYSSGMHVRLAFAVAAHLEPEILLVDEVLAVGDASFQRKSLGKMGEVAKRGRTVVFVSHNMTAMQSLCERVIWLDHGRVVEDGPAGQVIPNYLKGASRESSCTEQVWKEMASAPGNEKVRIRRVFVRPSEGDSSRIPAIDEEIEFGIEFWSLKPEQELSVNLQVVTTEAVVAFSTSSNHNRLLQGKRLAVGLHVAGCRVPANLLNSSQYRIRLRVVEDQKRAILKMDDALFFEMLDSPNRRGTYFGKRQGAVAPLLDWKLDFLGNVT